jgi:CheY-like chemotaxis protein
LAKKKRSGPTDETDDVDVESTEGPLSIEIGAIVHDLRNVFSAIRGFASVVSDELRPGDPVRDDLDQILKAVDRGVTVSQRLSALRARGAAPPTHPAARERPSAPDEVDPDRSDTWKVPQPKRVTAILIVEDDELLRTMIARVLRRNGYATAEAADGTEAEERALAHGQAFDLLLVDVGLPGLSGPEVVERLKQRWPSVKVLFMSGFGRAALAERGLRPGPHLMEKPFSPPALLERLEALLAPGSS